MLNEKFLERMRQLLSGEEYEAFLDSYSRPASRALRFNPQKATPACVKGFSKYLDAPLDFWEGAWLFTHDKIGSHPYHHAGAIYVQEPSAMTPVSSLDIKGSWRVLDMCASPGGKSTQAAEKLSEDGFLVSNEIVFPRAKVLAGNIERMGFKNTTVTCADTKALAHIFRGFFDLVIADVPCSGEGMFRKDEKAREEWSPENVLMCARRSREILDNAALCTKESGYVLYSTCTFSLEENEENVEWFLEAHPEFSLVTPASRALKASTEGVGLADTRRVYPHRSQGEGQFFALFRKAEGETRDTIGTRSALEAAASRELEAVARFFEENLVRTPPGNIFRFKDNLVLIPEKLPVPEKITYSCGVALGRVEKGVFRPHHQLFSALGSLFKNRLDFETHDAELEKYLRGEALSSDAFEGWGVVSVDSIPLGGVKLSSGAAKNHYPKGLRNR